MQAVDDINDDLKKSPTKPFTVKLKLGAIKGNASSAIRPSGISLDR